MSHVLLDWRRICERAASEVSVDAEQFRQRLLDKEQELTARMDRAAEHIREPLVDPAFDPGDASLNDEFHDEQAMEADTDTTELAQVRAALARINAGTFGLCEVDGKPIDEKRLAALPWTPYCAKHQMELERVRTPTL
jgi:RNA polymerase-binding transcription factor